MKKATYRILAIFFVLATLTSGCSYGGVSVSQDGYVVVPLNDGFLFGLLRTIYVCQVTPDGLTKCQDKESP